MRGGAFFLALACAVLVLQVPESGASQSQASYDDDVKLDLRHGVVKGYNSYISFLHQPSPSANGTCNSQAVIRVALPSPTAGLRLRLDFGESPRLWTLHVSDSPTGDGEGGRDQTTSNSAEVNVHNRQLRLYGNDLPSAVDASMNGGRLLKVYENFVKKDSKVLIDVSDERVEWKRGRRSDVVESPFLFTLKGQRPAYGVRDDFLYVGFNRVVGGQYRAGSGLCAAHIQLYQPPQHCAKSSHTCHKNAVCVNTRKLYWCKCKPGYVGDGYVCKDEDECAFDNGGCVHACVNTPGSFKCACKAGFALDMNGRDCNDVNECFTNKGSCSHQCINSLGSFQCSCSSGYSLDKSGHQCVYGQWCRVTYGCDHSCQHSSADNRVLCYCRDGYRLLPDGKACVRTCNHGNGGCQHRCRDSEKGPVCSCAPKYILNADKMTCTASCSVNNGGCEKKCSNSPAGPKCSCPAGFKLHQDGRTCIDVDECALLTAGCSHKCHNTRGSFECICPPGFKVDQDYKTCIDIDECSVNSTCDHRCENWPGSFVCHCRPGFQKFGITHCADRDECKTLNGGCAQQCTNSPGSYICSCGPGFKLHPNKQDCMDARQCIDLTPPSNALLSCQATNNKNRQYCKMRCRGNGRLMDKRGLTNATQVDISCDQYTDFRWKGLDNDTFPECIKMAVSPSFRRKARVIFLRDQCSFSQRAEDSMRRNLTDTLNREKRYKCNKRCHVSHLQLQCLARRKQFKRYNRRNKKFLMTTDIHFQVNAKKPKRSCDAVCTSERTRKRFNRSFKKMRRSVKRNKFILYLDGRPFKAIKKSFKADSQREAICATGTRLSNQACVGCNVGSFYHNETGRCQACPRGSYQNQEAQFQCKPCLTPLPGAGLEGASSKAQCSVLCDPGTFSESGKKPCQKCSKGTFQPNFGRISCLPCGGGITTNSTGSADFSKCLAKVLCKPGHAYNVTSQTCYACARGYYQPEAGQNFCLACPGQTSTDFPASTSAIDCKERRCGHYVGEHYGVLESPNYPGNYPVNVECVWKIRPEKRRRILIIVPEIDLAGGDECGDVIIMRKSKNPYSEMTFETCQSRHRPIAFVSESKKMWIQFKSNGNHTAKGFSIPFVNYNEEYQSLIEDIVKDGRLYSSNQHQQIFKDRQLLLALMEVIATPYKYLEYADVSRTMFPQSFIKLLTPKVRRFFQT